MTHTSQKTVYNQGMRGAWFWFNGNPFQTSENTLGEVKKKNQKPGTLLSSG